MRRCVGLRLTWIPSVRKRVRREPRAGGWWRVGIRLAVHKPDRG